MTAALLLTNAAAWTVLALAMVIVQHTVRKLTTLDCVKLANPK